MEVDAVALALAAGVLGLGATLGFAAGYGVRSLVSHRRRMRERNVDKGHW